MKPLLGQAQSQLNLDDLFSSSKSVAGNFSRPRTDLASTANSGSRKPNFSEVLLRNLEETKSAKPAIETRGATDTRPSKISMPDSKGTSQQDDLQALERRQRGHADDISMRQPYKSPNRESTDTSVGSSDAGATALRDAQISSPKPRAVDAQAVDTQALDTQALDTQALDTQALDPQAVDTQAANSKALAGNSAQKLDPALAPLQKQIGNQLTTDNVINNNAILAFITGRLDKLEPETLPTLLADSQLIKQVLGSGDVVKFMESPQSINELANLLELDQSLLSKAARDGLNPGDLVKPKEFIKALGIDPGQVASELTILQQKLPVEGVASYIDRARALAALKNKSELIPNPTEIPTAKMGQKRIQQGTPSLESTVPSKTGEEPINNIDYGLASMLAPRSMGQVASTISAKNSTTDSATRKSFLSDMTPRQDSNIGTMTETLPAAYDLENLGPIDHAKSLDDLNAPLTSAKNQKDIGTNESKSAQPLWDAFRSGINPMAAGLGPSANIEDADNILSDEPVISESDLKLSVSQADPFAMSSAEIDQNSSTRIEFAGNGVHSRSLEEILLDRNINLSIQAKQASRAPNDAGDINVQVMDYADAEKPKLPVIELVDMTESSSTLTDSSLGISLPNFDQSFRDDGRSFGESGKESPGDFATSIDTKASSSRESTVSFSSKLAAPSGNQARETLAQKILGQAEIMFKNGGGSMRMDVEAPGIGKVDVAINLNNNQLDVRIITASDQARDIITREVAGLRDGLTQQGLNLRGLEVGKASESSSRNFAGQGGQNFGQGAQDQRASYNDMKEYVQSFRNSYNPRPNDRFASSSPSIGKWNNVAPRSISGSRLEVRV